MEDSVNMKQQWQSLNRDAGSPDVLVIALFVEKGFGSLRDRKLSIKHLL